MVKPLGSISNRLISGSLVAATGKTVFAISALVINALITRLLQPEAVGAYYLIVSVVFIGALAAQLGVQQAVVKLIAGVKEPDKDQSIRRSIRTAFLVVGFGVMFISLVYVSGVGEWVGNSIFDSPLVADAAILVAIWIGLRSFQILVAQIFRGLHKIGLATVFEGSSTGVLIALALCCIWVVRNTATFHDILYITISALLISVLTGVFLLRKHYRKAAPGKGYDVYGLLNLSLPLFVATIALPAFAEAQLWILGMTGEEDTVAIYGSAFRLAKFVVVPLLIINSVIPPMIAQLVANDKKPDIERILRSTAAVAGIPSLVVLIIFVVFGDVILSIVFGDFYAQGANVLMILVFAQTVNALTGSPGVLLMMSGHQTVVMKFAFLSGFLGMMISIMLVHSMGYTGVALGVAVGMIAHNLGMLSYCRSKLDIKTHMSIKYIFTTIQRQLSFKGQ